jgi:hypothetical protein
LISKDEERAIKNAKKYLRELFYDDPVVVYPPVNLTLPEGELKLVELRDLNKTKWSFQTWTQMALRGRPGNRESRARACKEIVKWPQIGSESIPDLDVGRALSLFSNERERAITREGMFVLLCMKGDGTYLDNLKDYFIRKELSGHKPNPVGESSYIVFMEYMSDNGASMVDLFNLPDDLLSERVCDIVASNAAVKRSVVDMFAADFNSEDDDLYISRGDGRRRHYRRLIVEWRFLHRALGEEGAFDLLYSTLEQNPTEQTIDRWFRINQRQFAQHYDIVPSWSTDHVKSRLIDILSSEADAPIGEKLGKWGNGRYVMYGAVYGLGSFTSQDALEAIRDSMLKIDGTATFHYSVLNKNLEFSHVLLSNTIEDEKNKGDPTQEPAADHVASVLSKFSYSDRIFEQSHGDEVKELFEEVAKFASGDRFEGMLRYAPKVFSADEADEVIRIVATRRYPDDYSEDFDDAEKSKFIDNHLYGNTYLVQALETFAENGSREARELIKGNSLIQRVNEMLGNMDDVSLRPLLKGLGRSAREEIDAHLMSKYDESDENRLLILEASQREARSDKGVEIEGLEGLIIRDLDNYSKNSEEVNQQLLYSALDYPQNQEMVVSILATFEEEVDSGEERELGQLVKTLGAIGTADSNSVLDGYIPRVTDSLGRTIAAALANYPNKHWSNNVEQALLKALTDGGEWNVPYYLNQIKNGEPSADALEVVLEVLRNSKHMATKCFAIDCLGYHEHTPSVPVMISLLSLGRQEEEVAKPFKSKSTSFNYTMHGDLLDYLATALDSLRHEAIGPLGDALDDQDENTRFGAAIILIHIRRRVDAGQQLVLPNARLDEVTEENQLLFEEK